MSSLWAAKSEHWIIETTVGHNRQEAQANLYNFLSELDPAWGQKYWKRWEPAQRDARKRGYRIVRVKLVEMPHQ